MPIIPNITLATMAMSLAGFFMYLNLAGLTVSMHLEVDESYRGRMSSVIGLGFVCIGPLMSSPWGHIADNYGAANTMIASGIIFGICSAVFGYFYHQTVRLKVASESMRETAT
jgi:MFS family permease